MIPSKISATARAKSPNAFVSLQNSFASRLIQTAQDFLRQDDMVENPGEVRRHSATPKKKQMVGGGSRIDFLKSDVSVLPVFTRFVESKIFLIIVYVIYVH